MMNYCRYACTFLFTKCPRKLEIPRDHSGNTKSSYKINIICSVDNKYNKQSTYLRLYINIQR